MTTWSEMTQSPDGNRAMGRRPRSMTTSTRCRTSWCSASPRRILAGTTSRNASSSPRAPGAAALTSGAASWAAAPRDGAHSRSPEGRRTGGCAAARGRAQAPRGRRRGDARHAGRARSGVGDGDGLSARSMAPDRRLASDGAGEGGEGGSWVAWGGGKWRVRVICMYRGGIFRRTGGAHGPRGEEVWKTRGNRRKEDSVGSAAAASGAERGSNGGDVRDSSRPLTTAHSAVGAAYDGPPPHYFCS